MVFHSSPESFARGVDAACARGLGRQPRLARPVDNQAQHHAHAGRTEPVVPGNFLPEPAGDNRGHDHGGIDRQVIDLEGIGAAEVAGRVQRPDLAGEVALEKTDPEQQAK